ncbi:Expansin-A13 [Capsicum annuum]|nr:Expansin-A13 [Capsicum annuum]
MESHLTFKNDDEAGPSQKYDDNVEANLVLKDDGFDGLDDITHLELGQPGFNMMRRIIENSHGHTLKNQNILQSKEYFCAACSQGKLIIKPSVAAKVGIESPAFLESIQGDICGPIHPLCGPFKYYMVFIDASTIWSHVCLLSTRNMAFARLLAQIIRIKCRKEGGVRFTIGGAGIFLSVLISNVAGSGDIVAAKVKGSRTGWLPMGRNWGQNWHVNADLKNQPLSFELTSGDGGTLTSYNVVPKNWNFGQTFEGKQFGS